MNGKAAHVRTGRRCGNIYGEHKMTWEKEGSLKLEEKLGISESLNTNP